MKITGSEKNVHRSQHFSRYLTVMLTRSLEYRILLNLKVRRSLPPLRTGQISGENLRGRDTLLDATMLLSLTTKLQKSVAPWRTHTM